MKNRFMLSAAGVAAAAIGSTAGAAMVVFHYDYYGYQEAGWTITDSDGNSMAHLSTGSLYSGASGPAMVSSSVYMWNGVDYNDGDGGSYNLTLAAGTYTLVMTDSYGDGWNDAWGTNWSTTGADAFVYGSQVIAFSGGGSATGTFTVVPAPGALALLGLAGLAGTRRRRA